MARPRPLGSWQELMATFGWNIYTNRGHLAIPPLLPDKPGEVARVIVTWANTTDADLLRPFTAQDQELWFRIAKLSGRRDDWQQVVRAPHHFWEGYLKKQEFQLLFPATTTPSSWVSTTPS